MTKIDIFSGFLGAGKTTLIKKLIAEAFSGEKLVLIENEFGEIGIDGGFLKEAGIEITEMNSGCICCSLVGDFGEALKKVLDEYSPDRIIIEPSGVGKLSDVIKAVEGVEGDILLNSYVAVVDAKKCKVYMKNFGEFFNNQIENAGTIVLSHTVGLSEEKLQECISLVKAKNTGANIISTEWDDISGVQILETMENKNSLASAIKELEEEDVCPECGHHHHHHHEHHHDHDEHCCCEHDHHEHHHHHDEECHHHEHHDHDEHCCCGHHHEEHHHHHEEECHHEHHGHDEHCCCGHHHDEHHHHHHADEVFSSWGIETAAKFSVEGIAAILEALEDEEKYGMILRAKGIVAAKDSWIHFDYVPGEADIRTGGADVIGRICVIGSKINEKAISELFSQKEVQ